MTHPGQVAEHRDGARRRIVRRPRARFGQGRALAELRRTVLPHAVDPEIAAEPGQCFGEGAAETPLGAGDEGDLAVQGGMFR